MIEQLFNAWGSWPLFIGLALAALVRAWQVASPLIPAAAWDRVPSRVRPLVAILGAGLTAASVALIGGSSWPAAADAACAAWAAALASEQAIRLIAGKA